MCIVASERLSKHVTTAQNIGNDTRSVGRVVFYAIPVVFEGKWAISPSQNFLFVIPNNLIETVECYFTFNNLALEKVSVCLSGSSLSTQY
jgi:hypothetical protein